MQGSVSFVINKTKYEFTLDKGDDLAVMNQLITLGNPPLFCKEAKDGVYKLETNKDKEGNIYVNMVCYSGDGKVYKAKLGSYKDKSGFFWHKYALDEFAMKRLKNAQDMPDDVDEEFNG